MLLTSTSKKSKEQVAAKRKKPKILCGVEPVEEPEWCRMHHQDSYTGGYLIVEKEDSDKPQENYQNRYKVWTTVRTTTSGDATLLDYQACVNNTPCFIALVAKLLEYLKLPFVVASDEADGTFAALAKEGIAISYDSDLLAHGVKLVV
jgi:hypothetical protein